jgi:pimeloyl-ACP methyl ester carboxylesterase
MSLHIYETGPASAPTIVFLHGGGGASWMWQPQIEALTDFHLLVPDLPEHGQSLDVKPFSIKDSVERIADLIRSRAHGGRAHVVGLSEGAQVTIALLAAYAELVDHAIVSSALLRPIPGAKMMTPGLIAASVKLFVEPFKNMDAWIRLNMKYSAGVPGIYFPQFKKDFQHMTGDQFAHVMVENQRFRMPQGLEKVTVPTLVVAGKKEYDVMRQSVRDLASTMPNAKGFLVAHSRRMSLAEEHNWNMTAPELFTTMVKAWIADQPLPAELQPIKD